MAKTFALLVGIDDYAPETGVKKLNGCVADVGNFERWLVANTAAADLSVRKLTDAAATRAAVIAGFREHLKQAGAGDTAVFHYCGHGARAAAAPEFAEYYPVGKDEGLVCIDSRLPGGYDLADKELAVLIAEVAASGAHVTIILDCCHSGSGTRNADSLRGGTPRVTYDRDTPRPLDSYIDGYYAQQHAGGAPISIPEAPHILLSACERNQLAQEMIYRGKVSGAFTTTLCAVLDASRGDISYTDLFVRCRAAVVAIADDQNPQFEPMGGFNAQSGFLGRAARFTATRYSVTHDGSDWRLDLGAVHGLPADPGRPLTLALFPEDAQDVLAGNAVALRIMPQQSIIKPDFDADPQQRYRAEITSLPVPPLLLAFDGDAASAAAIAEVLGRETLAPLALTPASAATPYGLQIANGELQLIRRAGAALLARATLDGGAAAAAADLTPALRHVATWERRLAIANPATKFDTSRIAFEVHCDQFPGGKVEAPSDAPLTVEVGGEVLPRAKITVTNTSAQLVHAVLAHFDADFGITILRNEPIGEDGVPVTLWGGGKLGFTIGKDQVLAVENLLLIVSTERIDDFLLAQLPLDKLNVRGMGEVDEGDVYVDEWFTRRLQVRVVRRAAVTGAQDVTLANGAITIKGNPAITAAIAMTPATPPTRGIGMAPDLPRVLAGRGLSPLSFTNTRSADGADTLELTGIANPSALRETPLQIELNVPLAPEETILPLVFDGAHVLIAGDSWRDDNGRTQLSISELPASEVSTRSLTGAIKLYFFKTYLGRDNVNMLRWVEYQPDGSFTYRTDDLAAKVAAARNILLLVHGIIGDTEGMAAGVKACGVADKFDLVLTYDYESLNTLIGDTARALQAALAAVGIDAGDGKSLTMLVHSMGGLVSRWFIEREGGAKVVDHLIMCGTPNNGSPFGRIDSARRIISLLLGIALNYLPTPGTIAAAALAQTLLTRSKKVTPALEQMNPDSDFITTLNHSPDPGVRYSILAGNIDEYEESADALFAQLVTKIGQNDYFELLFGRRPNDIAVGVESILGVGAGRARPPAQARVACHHLNYFVSANGQAALRAIDWQV